MRLVVVAGLIGVLLAASTRARALDPQTPQAPVFRGGTWLVPIDLRVLDRLGQSITGLTAADISVREDGVVQDVKYFSSHHAFSRARRGAIAASVATAAGCGPCHTEPARVPHRARPGSPAGAGQGSDGLLRFVRERLLPQIVAGTLVRLRDRFHDRSPTCGGRARTLPVPPRVDRTGSPHAFLGSGRRLWQQAPAEVDSG